MVMKIKINKVDKELIIKIIMKLKKLYRIKKLTKDRYKHIINMYMYARKLLFKNNNVINNKLLSEKEKAKILISILYHDIGYTKVNKNIKINKIIENNIHQINSYKEAIKDNFIEDKDILEAILNHTGAKNEIYLLSQKYNDFTIYNKYYSENKNRRKLEKNKIYKYLTYFDLHINSKGEIVTLKERLNEIKERYDKKTTVYKNIKMLEKYFEKIVKEIKLKK